MTRIVRIAAWLAMAGAFWFFLAPTQIGGRDSYVFTDGISMLPTIHGGSLVVLRSEPSYHVGEIAGYRNKQLDGDVVLHRIVAIRDGRYTFKGDNNPSADLDHPTRAALVGRDWIYSPLAGRIVENLRVPWVGAVFLGLFATWAYRDIGRGSSRRQRRRRHRTA